MKHRRRSLLIERVERYLRQAHSPRLLMTAILLATGLTGFLASYTLLHLGLNAMGLRYPLAVIVAYGAFLALLRMWLGFHRAHIARAPQNAATRSDLFDITDVPADVLFDSSGGSGAPSVADAPELDEAIFLVVAVVAILGALLASLYVVYVAPTLLAEAFVDGVLLTGLYRRFRRHSPQHWIYGALRHTCVPALITASLFSIAGFAMHKYDPAANSIGHVCQRALRHHNT